MKSQLNGTNIFLSFFSLSVKRNTYLTNVAFRHHLPENRILMIYNQNSGSLRHVLVTVTDIYDVDYEYFIDKIPYRDYVEVHFDQLKNTSSESLKDEIDRININISDKLEKYYVSPDGKIEKA
jgi:hypothetical protein